MDGVSPTRPELRTKSSEFKDRRYTVIEQHVLTAINDCMIVCYEPLIQSYLADNHEFQLVNSLLENLMHYEDQILMSGTPLKDTKAIAIAQAVTRLIDSANAILDIDLIIRSDNDVMKELDPSNETVIKIFQAHVTAQLLRDKLLLNYFNHDRKFSLASATSPSINITTCDDSSTIVSTMHRRRCNSSVTLGLQSLSSSNLSNAFDTTMRRSPLGSNNSLASYAQDGRRTPQSVIGPHNEYEISSYDLQERIEHGHLLTSIKTSSFIDPDKNATRASLLPEILSKIARYLAAPTSASRLTPCFELLDALLISIESIPVQNRTMEVNMIAKALFMPILKKVYIDYRDELVVFQHAHWTACLLSIIRILNQKDFDVYLQSSSMNDLKILLKEYFFVIKRYATSYCQDESSTNSKRKTLSGLGSTAFADLESAFEADTTVSDDEARITFPQSWLDMTTMACEIFISSLQHCQSILTQFFPTNGQLWMDYVDCIIRFLLHDSLKPNRQRIRTRQVQMARRLRESACYSFWATWQSLGVEMKTQLMGEKCELLLKALMVLEADLRPILLPAFSYMMYTDFLNQIHLARLNATPKTSTTSGVQATNSQNSAPTINASKPAQSLQRDESLPYLSCFEYNKSVDEYMQPISAVNFARRLVIKLSSLMLEDSFGDQSFKRDFTLAMANSPREQWLSNTPDIGQYAWYANQATELLAEFMQICLDCREANRRAYKHFYLLCLSKLVQFARDKIQLEDMYLSNLYKLCYLHHSSSRYVEAGCVLLDHARSLPWSDERPSDSQRIVSRYFQTTSEHTSSYKNLKIFLYNTIIEYFDKGQLWEAAVPVCRELAEWYQFKTFEYAKLANLLAKMSVFFRNIVDMATRYQPEYFRVTFYGVGFPETLQHLTIVYRGKPYEKLGDFQATLLSKYPDAKLLGTLAKPDDATINEPEARYLQVNACTPIVDVAESLACDNLAGVSDAIVNYYRHNECRKFSFSRRVDAPAGNSVDAQADSFANMWRERTTLTTSTLPGMLPFSVALCVETSIVAPIESAIEVLQRKNDELHRMVNRFRADDEQRVEDVRLLSQLIMGIVDAAVNGGIAKYEEAFLAAPPQARALSPDIGRLSIRPVHAQQQQQHQGLTLKLDIDHNSSTTTTTTNKHELCSTSHNTTTTTTTAQVDKLKHLIAQQVPLLDEAIRLHADRVADIMRPQHEHIEASFKRLKQHVLANYARYLPIEYQRRQQQHQHSQQHRKSSGTLRSFRSLGRHSPNRSHTDTIGGDRRISMLSSTSAALSETLKRVSPTPSSPSAAAEPTHNSATLGRSNDGEIAADDQDLSPASDIPYKQFGRKVSRTAPLPFLFTSCTTRAQSHYYEDLIDAAPSDSLYVSHDALGASIKTHRNSAELRRAPRGANEREEDDEEDDEDDDDDDVAEPTYTRLSSSTDNSPPARLSASANYDYVNLQPPPPLPSSNLVTKSKIKQASGAPPRRQQQSQNAKSDDKRLILL